MTLIALVSILFLIFSFTIKTTAEVQCLPDQRHALIQLKQGFNITELNSWNSSTDCCIWDGIACDEQTGMVTALNLNSLSISGEINPALFNLSSLRYLNLAWNDFDNLILPQTGFERLSNLTHLNLSYSGFAGQVPMSISALTNLISLDLSTDHFNTNPLYLHDTGLKTLLRNLTKLQVLCLNTVDISLNGSEWGSSVFQVGTTLQYLSMKNCGLMGNLPDELFHLRNLTELDLSYNSEMFTRPLPDSFGNLQYLSRLGLYNSGLYGEVPPSIANLTRLQYLNLGSNKLTGMIPMSLFSHPSLKLMNLAINQFGYLPEFSNGSSILEDIFLAFNNLQGQLSISIFKSPKLVKLLLASNNFNGTLNLDIIKNNKKLEYLDLSNNKLSIIEDKKNNESFYASFPQLIILGLGSCNLIKFPSFLSYQINIYSLHLSNNSLTGEILLSICNVTSPTVLDLSYNNLTGTVPSCLLGDTKLKVLNLKNNKLSGPLPQNISQECEFQVINMNGNLINGSLPKSLMYCNSLEILDLGNNRIVNKFPYWMGNLENLKVLVLRSNMLYGKISDQRIKTKAIGSFFPMLKVLDLSSNHFIGTLPKTIFVNMKAMMGALNTSSPYYSSTNVDYISYVDSVTYKGQIFNLMFSINIFSYIDLSNNKLWGRISEEIGQLKLLDVLNLSHNALIGPIPREFVNLHQLQLLDLSSNQLSGHIPQELTSLTFLSALNLSYNNLVGGIPQACQFSTFLDASYLGNPGLCGSPLLMQCEVAPSNHGFNKSLHSKSSTDIIGLAVSIGLGLGVGFASAIWALISWERFNFVVDRFYFRYFH